MTIKIRRLLPVAVYVISAHGLLLGSFGIQADPQAQAVERFFKGHKVLIGYRQGSPLGGTYFSIQVHFCESGTYRSLTETHRQNGSHAEEVRHWSEQGTWVVTTERGEVGVRCLSSSGRTTFIPVRSWPSRDAGNMAGISALPQGDAQCP